MSLLCLFSAVCASQLLCVSVAYPKWAGLGPNSSRVFVPASFGPISTREREVLSWKSSSNMMSADYVFLFLCVCVAYMLLFNGIDSQKALFKVIAEQRGREIPKDFVSALCFPVGMSATGLVAYFTLGSEMFFGQLRVLNWGNIIKLASNVVLQNVTTLVGGGIIGGTMSAILMSMILTFNVIMCALVGLGLPTMIQSAGVFMITAGGLVAPVWDLLGPGDGSSEPNQIFGMAIFMVAVVSYAANDILVYFFTSPDENGDATDGVVVCFGSSLVIIAETFVVVVVANMLGIENSLEALPIMFSDGLSSTIMLTVSELFNLGGGFELAARFGAVTCGVSKNVARSMPWVVKVLVDFSKFKLVDCLANAAVVAGGFVYMYGSS